MRVLLAALMLFLAPAAYACELALVVALDVSRSVDKFEYKLMRDGIARAFLEEEVVQLITWMPGGLMVTVTQWGGTGQQRQAIGWRHLTDRASVEGFIDEFSTQRRGYFMADTSVSEALIHADQMLMQPGIKCRRQVIDVSGDGISNAGPAVLPISSAVGAKGVTVNGLVVTGATPDPVPYFLTQVISGPLAFVETADSYADYSRAMKRKLLRELAPNLSMVLKPEFISETPPQRHVVPPG